MRFLRRLVDRASRQAGKQASKQPVPPTVALAVAASAREPRAPGAGVQRAATVRERIPIPAEPPRSRGGAGGRAHSCEMNNGSPNNPVEPDKSPRMSRSRRPAHRHQSASLTPMRSGCSLFSLAQQAIDGCQGLQSLFAARKRSPPGGQTTESVAIYTPRRLIFFVYAACDRSAHEAVTP